jgi:hypothetical protein
MGEIAAIVTASFRGDATGSRECAPDDRLRIEPGNLEIPRCAIAHLRSGPSKSAVADLDNDIAELG